MIGRVAGDPLRSIVCTAPTVALGMSTTAATLASQRR